MMSILPAARALALAAALLLPLAARSQSPLTLEGAVHAALENNPQFKAAAAEADAARARADQARSARLPRLDFSQSFTRGNNPVYVFGTLLTQRQFTAANFALAGLNAPTPLDNFQTRLDGAWRLYDFGVTGGQVRAASSLRTAQDFKTEQARQDLILRVAQSYFQWRIAGEHQAAAQQAVAAAEASEQRIRNLEQAGLVVSSDLLSAQVHTAQMREREIRARNGAELALAVLQRETGLNAAPDATAAPRSVRVPEETPRLEDLVSAAMTERPALRAAELEQQAAQSQTKSVRAEFAPKIDVFAGFERDAEALGGPSGTNWTAGARLHVNLFAGGADRARLAEAAANERRAAQYVEWFRSGVKLEVRQAFLETQAARQRAEVMRATTARAEESLRILQNRYEAGLANLTDLLRAQVAVLESRTSYLAAVQDTYVARAQLERAAGKLTPESPLLKFPEAP